MNKRIKNQIVYLKTWVMNTFTGAKLNYDSDVSLYIKYYNKTIRFSDHLSSTNINDIQIVYNELSSVIQLVHINQRFAFAGTTTEIKPILYTLIKQGLQTSLSSTEKAIAADVKNSGENVTCRTDSFPTLKEFCDKIEKSKFLKEVTRNRIKKEALNFLGNSYTDLTSVREEDWENISKNQKTRIKAYYNSIV